MPITGHSIFTVAWWVGMLALAVLVVTGIWLSFAYQPSPAEAWDDLGLGGTSPSATLTWVHVAAARVVAGAAVTKKSNMMVGFFIQMFRVNILIWKPAIARYILSAISLNRNACR